MSKRDPDRGRGRPFIQKKQDVLIQPKSDGLHNPLFMYPPDITRKLQAIPMRLAGESRPLGRTSDSNKKLVITILIKFLLLLLVRHLLLLAWRISASGEDH